MFCARCGKSNDNSAKYCFNCGSEILQSSSEEQATQQPSGVLEEFFSAIVGSKNQEVYLRHFRRFEDQGKVSPSWHWPAFFVTFYWLLYRKMWLNALIYFFFPYLVMIPIGLVAALLGDSGDVIVGIGYLVFFVVLVVLPPMYAHAFYYKHCKKKIAEARSSPNDLQRQLGELSGKGGTSNVFLIIVTIFIFVAIIGILAAIAIPAYQDYTTRARMAEAVSIGKNATALVDGYYGEHQVVPDTLEQAGFVAPQSSSVKKVAVNSENGVVTITMAATPLADKKLLMVPSLDENSHINWKCMSEEIQDRYLPV